jgi:peroxiredoxin
MINKTLALSVFMFLLALPFAHGQGSVSVGPQGEVSTKVAAPDFTLQDLSGKTWRLSDQKGKVVLLDFTTTWCPWCVKDIPNLKKITQKYKNQPFEFTAIYIQESRQKVSAFAQKKEIPYRILLDPDAKIAREYSVRGVPTKVIVDKAGNILCWMCKEEEAQLDKALRK